jgi:integrase
MGKPTPRNRGQIIPKGDGRWLVRFYAGRGPDGKRLYPAKLVEGPYKTAEKELTKMLRESDTGTFVPASKQSLREYCTLWLEGKVGLSAKTRRDYVLRLVKDVYPVLGNVKLDQVSELRIAALYAGMVTRGLSPRTIQYTHTVLSQALEKAVRIGQLVKNPCTYVELPKRIKKKPVIFSPAEAHLFLERTSGSRWNPLWYLLLTTGLRPQEALALDWTDLDLDAGMMRVTKALVEDQPGVYIVGPCKSENGVRPVSLPSTTVDVLKAHRKSTGAIGGWVFPSLEGTHYDLSRPRKAWKRDIKNVNATLAQLELPPLPTPKLYGARHSHMTHLLMAGVHPKAAAQRGGHTEAVSMDVYSHVLPEVDAQAGEKINSLLFMKVAK